MGAPVRGMSDPIGDEWKLLYSNNPKIQAFAVCKDSQIIWQTHNLHQNLVNEVEQLTVAPSSTSSSVSINGITYKRVSSSSDSYLATADNNQGHFLMYKIEGKTWVLAWAAPDSVPELTIVDVARTAISLAGKL